MNGPDNFIDNPVKPGIFVRPRKLVNPVEEPGTTPITASTPECYTPPQSTKKAIGLAVICATTTNYFMQLLISRAIITEFVILLRYITASH